MPLIIHPRYVKHSNWSHLNCREKPKLVVTSMVHPYLWDRSLHVFLQLMQQEIMTMKNYNLSPTYAGASCITDFQITEVFARLIPTAKPVFIGFIHDWCMGLGVSNWIQCLIILLQNLHSPGIGFSCITAQYLRTEHIHSICFLPQMHSSSTFPRTEVLPKPLLNSQLLISVAMVAWNQTKKHSFKSGKKFKLSTNVFWKGTRWSWLLANLNGPTARLTDTPFPHWLAPIQHPLVPDGTFIECPL